MSRAGKNLNFFRFFQVFFRFSGFTAKSTPVHEISSYVTGTVMCDENTFQSDDYS